MLSEEAEWIGQRLSEMRLKASAQVLNIGSSTLEFRTNVQPYIHEKIFKPLAENNIRTVHLDLKKDAGVDMNGDLLEPGFRKVLKERNFDVVICSNLLEHVPETKNFCNAIVDILGAGSRLIVTVPYRYPYHKDPIDTMFRPSVQELYFMFPGTRMITGNYVQSDMSMWGNMRKNWKFGVLSVIRLLAFHRPGWKNYIQYFRHIPARYAATCLVLEKV